MKTVTLTQVQIERFIALFLPEGSAQENDPLQELRSVYANTKTILERIDLHVSIESLFDTFREVSYYIGVEEPNHRKNAQKPYVDTNADKIFIGIDIDKLQKFKQLKEDMISGKSTSPLAKDMMMLLINDPFKK